MPHDAMAQDPCAWRRELSTRLDQYRSRRKPRPPRYPSLGLDYPAAVALENHAPGNLPSTSDPEIPARSPRLVSVRSDHALALPPDAAQDLGSMGNAACHIAGPMAELKCVGESGVLPVQPTAGSARIIEFPRSWAPPPPVFDGLAEPVRSHPRILEAPEVIPPPPALGGITIETEPPPFAKRPGIDLPLKGASFERRVLAALLDSIIVAAGCALFGWIFWDMTPMPVHPARMQIAEILAGAAVAFWGFYQYLFVIYAGATPGLRIVGLQLVRFDGSGARRNLRRWRVLASFLSACSLGMGYAWIFLDEDSLCWHDRITHTYLETQKSNPP